MLNYEHETSLSLPRYFYGSRGSDDYVISGENVELLGEQQVRKEAFPSKQLLHKQRLLSDVTEENVKGAFVLSIVQILHMNILSI